MPSKRSHNKSLHPIGSVVPAFACCTQGAANAGPPAPTGELNRYAGTRRNPLPTTRIPPQEILALHCYRLDV